MPIYLPILRFPRKPFFYVMVATIIILFVKCYLIATTEKIKNHKINAQILHLIAKICFLAVTLSQLNKCAIIFKCVTGSVE